MKFHIDILNQRYNLNDKETKIFLMATFMYHNGVINREKLLAMYSLNRPEKPQKPHKHRGFHLAMDLGIVDKEVKSDRFFKRTYRCSITKKWHDHESIVQIYEEAFNENRKETEISLEEMIKYAQLMLNKHRNVCIDYIKHTIVNPLLESLSQRIDPNYSYGNDESKMLTSLIGVEASSLGYKPYHEFSLYGYCCEDCDGDYSYAKESAYKHEVSSHVKRKAKEITETTLEAAKKDMSKKLYYIELARQKRGIPTT